MKVTMYMSTRCEKTIVYETDRITCQDEDRASARESIGNGWEPYLCFTSKDGHNICTPSCFVISIEA